MSQLDVSWQERGLCQHEDPEQYDEVWVTAHAISVCGRCPVRIQCLEYALLADERYGVWGGTVPVQRQKLSALVGPVTAGEVAEYYLHTGDIPRR